MFDPSTKILVVDDVLMMRKLVVKSCQEIGFTNFVEASDGKIAWELLNIPGQTIGLIISDITMPNMTGVDLLRKVRADKKFVALPFLLVTAEAEKHQIVDAIQLGVSNYLVKPFSPDAIHAKLQAVYEKVTGKK